MIGKAGVPFSGGACTGGKSSSDGFDKQVNMDTSSDADWQMVTPGNRMDLASVFLSNIQYSIPNLRLVAQPVGGKRTNKLAQQV